jgi:hypothetical protein
MFLRYGCFLLNMLFFDEIWCFSNCFYCFKNICSFCYLVYLDVLTQKLERSLVCLPKQYNIFCIILKTFSGYLEILTFLTKTISNFVRCFVQYFLMIFDIFCCFLMILDEMKASFVWCFDIVCCFFFSLTFLLLVIFDDCYSDEEFAI